MFLKRTGLNRDQVNGIDLLVDDILLEIFGFCVTPLQHPFGFSSKWRVESWQSLVHVCRRWRCLVFQSPRRLELQLYCTHKTRVKDTLDVWPALPLIIEGHMSLSSDTDNIITALGQNSRVCQLDIFLRCLAGWQLDKVLAAMQVPFPELTEMSLISKGKTMSIIPDSFLGGSVPRLRVFRLKGIPCPGLPKLLMSATRLVSLELSDELHSVISPEEMVSLISVSSSLEILTLWLQNPLSHPSWEAQSLPPQKRSILPALNGLYFTGLTEYLEELVTRTDTPRLYHMHLAFFNEIGFDCLRLAQFIDRTPELTRALDKAFVYFNDEAAGIALRHHLSSIDNLDILISCLELDRQLSCIEQICNSSLHLLSTVECLCITRNSQPVCTKDAIEIETTALWLQLLRPFTAVKNLYLSEVFAPDIAASLQEHAGGGMIEVLPSLQNIFVEGLRPSGSFQDSIGQFVDARQLSGLPISISLWDRDSDSEWM